MDLNNQQIISIAYTTSNVVGVLFLVAAVKRPKLARLMFLLLFGWASCINFKLCHQQPEVYLTYADKSIHVYSDFINGWFANHVTMFVSFIAFGQGLVALGMLLKGILVKLACVGAIIFLLSIAPLGLYSAFPFSISVSAAAYFIILRDDKNYLWKSNQSKELLASVHE